MDHRDLPIPLEPPLASSDPARPEVAQEPPPPGKPKGRKGLGAALTGAGVLLLKFKTILAFLLEFKIVLYGAKFLGSTWTLFLSLWLYGMAFGWRFGLVLICILIAHELGHYAAFRAYGLPAKLPVFIPFLGAFTAGAVPPDLETDAHIALAGPLTGLGLAAACMVLGDSVSSPFWLACAYSGALLNLFNMIPTPPFDGGRVIAAISPELWLIGSVVFVGCAIWLHLPIFLVLLIAALGGPTMWAQWRHGIVDPRAAAMTNGARLRVGLWYLATLAGLLAITGFTLNASQAARGVAW